jgi:hypothetical protein
MKGKKIILLFLALLLPVCVFLFLKTFGKNQFDVPPFYQEELPEGSCGISYSAPYVLPDSIMRSIKNGKADVSLFLINFSSSKEGLPKVHEEVTPEEVSIIPTSDLSMNPDSIAFIRDCILIAKPGFDLVLIDNQKRIRGYYKATDREEVDRLLIELEIILKKY